MEKYLLSILFLGLVVKGYSQNYELPQEKYDEKQTFNEFFSNQWEYFGEGKLINFTLAYGYHQTNILNPSFYALKESGDIERKYGHAINVRYTLYPFFIDSKFFQSKFATTFPGTSQSTMDLRHRGFELSASLMMPLFGKLSQHIVPYIGAGYQSASFGFTEGTIWDDDNSSGSSSSDNGPIDISVTSLSAPVLKTGMIFNFAESFFSITVEYTQSFKLNDVKSFNELLVTAGFQIYKDH